MNIGKFILRRLSLQIFVLLGLTMFTFILMFGLPGDPAALLFSAGGIAAGMDEYHAFRAKWGLDLPMWKQYLNFVGNSISPTPQPDDDNNNNNITDNNNNSNS